MLHRKNNQLSADGPTYLAALAALVKATEPVTAYGVWRRAGELMAPLLSPTQTSVSRFLASSSEAEGQRPECGLVRQVGTGSVRAEVGYQATRKAREALRAALVEPVNLSTAVYGLNAFDAKMVMASRYAGGEYLGALVDNQLVWLKGHALDASGGGAGVVAAIMQRRAGERELLVHFLEGLLNEHGRGGQR